MQPAAAQAAPGRRPASALAGAMSAQRSTTTIHRTSGARAASLIESLESTLCVAEAQLNGGLFGVGRRRGVRRFLGALRGVLLWRCVQGHQSRVRLVTKGPARTVTSRRFGPQQASHFGVFAEFERKRFDDLAVVLFEAGFTFRLPGALHVVPRERRSVLDCVVMRGPLPARPPGSLRPSRSPRHHTEHWTDPPRLASATP